MPVGITGFCNSTYFLCIIFASYFNDTLKLAGVGIAISILSVIRVAVGGITQPVETLTAHAYGVRDFKLCGLYLNRALLVGFGCYLITLILAFFFFYRK